MPRISDDHRELRRAQILEAAWRCFQREGVQATRMEHIISESGLSASAMYRYFRNKDDIILAAIEASMQGLSEVLQPIFESDADPDAMAFTLRITTAIRRFAARSGFDLLSIAVHGWSEAQRNAEAKQLLQHYYRALRERLAHKVRHWQQSGRADPGVDAQDTARALQGLIFGYVVQAVILDEPEASGLLRGVKGLASTGLVGGKQSRSPRRPGTRANAGPGVGA